MTSLPEGRAALRELRASLQPLYEKAQGNGDADEMARLTALADEIDAAIIALAIKTLSERAAIVADLAAKLEARRQYISNWPFASLAGQPAGGTQPLPPKSAPTGPGGPTTANASSSPAPAPAAATPVVAAVNFADVDPERKDTDLTKLHPTMRAKVNALIGDLAAAGIPMKPFEAFRSPERQRHLFAQGRTRPGAKVTNADAWESLHQYGLAVDFVINSPGINPWEDGTPQTAQWWTEYHRLAGLRDLNPLSFEKPHVELKGFRFSQLLAGEFPPDGDDGWETNLNAAIARWTGPKPPRAGSGERPPLAVTAADFTGSAQMPSEAWKSRFGGQEWRYDANGVYLRGVGGGQTPLRSAGAPVTCQTIVNLYGEIIAEAGRRYGIPAELIVMTIATEAGAYRASNFTGPDTFRWEPNYLVGATGDPAIDGKVRGDYSAGPMQVLADTGRWINAAQNLGYDAGQAFRFFKKRPANPPDDLDLYDAAISINVGCAVIKQRMGDTGLDPILVAAAYNAGSIRSSGDNLWHIHAFGNHLDRAAQWFGDACLVLS